MQDNNHDVSIGESIASKELTTIEAQPSLKLTELLGQCLFNQLLLHCSLFPLWSKKALGDTLKDSGDGHRLADHLPLVLQDWHGAIWQYGFHLCKIFASQSDVIKLDPSVGKNETSDLSTTTGGEVGQPQLLRVARLHLQALAQTLSQFLDHFLSVSDASFSVSPN